MNLIEITPHKALNKAFLKVKPSRNEINTFKDNFKSLMGGINENETEEFHKNLVTKFLRKTYYGDKYSINTKGRNDLVIHTGKDAHSPVGVIIEAKKPTNTAEMLRKDHINVKAFQEMVLYYLRERITGGNLEMKYLIATNVYEWFIFDASVFEKAFAHNSRFVKQFKDFEAGRLAGNNTDFFYKQVAEPEINAVENAIEFTHFDIRDYQHALHGNDKESDNKLIALYKIFSPEHLLKLPFANDSNSLDKAFYSELLHIIGLTETKDGGKKLIERKKEGERDSGSLIENAINQLDSLDKISRLAKPQQFGENQQERLFNVGLELVITWLNRILFLKLLEAQLIKYHKGDETFAFLNLNKVPSFDELNDLFFKVLAKQTNERTGAVKDIFANVPYLNSSLFEPTELEHTGLFISQLSNKTIPVPASTVLKNEHGKKVSGNMDTLQYLFEFLNAYDFSSEGSEDIQENNKTLINASVLGLIFEKINGYKDGSFFTPGFITMYICRETIRRAVIQKFNDVKGWNCQNMDQLFNEIRNKAEANQIINSLKICDPAVGSGHFLVSALNEIIAVKSDLKILIDSKGRTLRDYQFEVVNDELVVTDDDGRLFEYNPNNSESQLVQETLFDEKQTIIQNCLFGVDLNPNSVKICRLRLWIELLKNSYYKNDGKSAELETLPNIDINIKCGNSLISRYGLDSDIKPALRKSKWTIASYREAIMSYRNATSKDEKRDMEKLIDQIKNDFESEINHTDKRVLNLEKLKNRLKNLESQDLFGKSKDVKEIKKTKTGIQKLEAEIENVKSNKIFENAFEWRFEFPEVLNADGKFIGFDAIIGNPPYVQLQKDSGKLADMFAGCEYKTFERTGDIYALFYELSYQLLRDNGVLTFITSNKWMRANYGKSLRKYFVEHGNIAQLIDFGDARFFENATTYTNIFLWEKIEQKTETHAWDLSHACGNSTSMEELLEKHNGYEPLFDESSFVILKGVQSKIKSKIEDVGVPLKEWGVSINYGIKTGFNEAFIIDGKKKDELIALDPRNAEIIKPILRGRDIKKYSANFADLWLISTLPALHININDYPAVKNYLATFGTRLEQIGGKGCRKKTSNKWFETQDQIAYYQEFEKEKIIWAEIVYDSAFYFDNKGFYPEATAFIMTGESIKYITALLNSRFLTFSFKSFYAGGDLRGNTFRYKKVFLEKLPIPKISKEVQKPFEELVAQISAAKQADPAADTTVLGKEIDQLVYKLYGLTEEEIQLVEATSL